MAFSANAEAVHWPHIEGSKCHLFNASRHLRPSKELDYAVPTCMELFYVRMHVFMFFFFFSQFLCVRLFVSSRLSYSGECYDAALLRRSRIFGWKRKPHQTVDRHGGWVDIKTEFSFLDELWFQHSDRAGNSVA